MRPSRPTPAKATLLVVALTTTLAACDVLSIAPEERLVVGAVAFYAVGDPFIDLPDTVDASVPFAVTVHTYGGGCERIGPTETTVEASAALVVPYDYTVSSPGIACTDILNVFQHVAVLRLDLAGAATVTIRGREEPSGALREYPRPVWVR
jgi:hypothetical protein